MSNTFGTPPTAQSDEYLPGRSLDFLLTLEGWALAQDSVYAHAEVEVYNTTTGDPVGVDDDVYFNPRVGAHSFLQTITHIMDKGSATIETLTEYPRYVATTSLGTELDMERGTTTPSAIELRVPYINNTKGLLLNAQADKKLSWVVKLRTAINKFNQPLNESLTGPHRLRIVLAPARNVLFGLDADNFSYKLSNFSIYYDVVPQIRPIGPVTTEVVFPVEDNIRSTKATTTSLIPGSLVKSFVASFIREDRYQDYQWDSLACEAPPGYPPGAQNVAVAVYGFDEINFAVNYNENNPNGFLLRSREAILKQFFSALRSLWEHRYGYNLVKLNNGGQLDTYAIGVNFGGLIDFSSKAFSLKLSSAITTDPGYRMVGYATGLVDLSRS